MANQCIKNHCHIMKADLIKYHFDWKIENWSFSIASTDKLISSTFPQDGKNKWHLELARCSPAKPDAGRQFFNICLHFDSDDNEQFMKYAISCKSANEEWSTKLFRPSTQKTYNFSLIETKMNQILLDCQSPDDTLVISCDIEIMKEMITIAESDNLIPFNTPSYGICDDIKALYKISQFYDVTLIVDKKKFEAHTTILAARSSTFEKMFADMRMNEEDEIEIANVTADVFAELLRYIYTDEVPLLEIMVMNLLPAADHYNLNGLRAMCENTLYKTIDINNAAELLIVADRWNADYLKIYLLRFINTNLQEIMLTQTYKELEKSYSHLIVEALRALKL